MKQETVTLCVIDAVSGRLLGETLREADANRILASAKRNHPAERFVVTDKSGKILWS